MFGQCRIPGMSVKKIYATPHEPHTWFEAFESPEERRLRAEVREFAWANFEHQRDDCDAKFRCRHLLPLVAEQGYLATLVAKEHGGEGQGLATSVIIAQEMGGVIPSLAAYRAVNGNFVSKPLEEFGTAEQIDRFLRPLCAAEITTALAISEPTAGSDVGGIRTRAVRDGDSWVINGFKQHISGGAEADFILVYAVTDPEASLSTRLTAFLVPTATPGVDPSDEESTMGVRGIQGPEEASEACNEESSIVKQFCGEQCFFVCDTAMQVFGGLGYEQGTAVEAMFRDSRVFRFGGGTDEIQRHIIQRDEYKRL